MVLCRPTLYAAFVRIDWFVIVHWSTLYEFSRLLPRPGYGPASLHMRTIVVKIVKSFSFWLSFFFPCANLKMSCHIAVRFDFICFFVFFCTFSIRWKTLILCAVLRPPWLLTGLAHHISVPFVLFHTFSFNVTIKSCCRHCLWKVAINISNKALTASNQHFISSIKSRSTIAKYISLQSLQHIEWPLLTQ